MTNENKITFNNIKDALIAVADELEKNRQYYNDLDSPLGDSDHGDSVCSSFKTIKGILLECSIANDDIGELLKNVGKTILLSGGGAMGPLFGSAFIDAGKAVSGKSVIFYNDFIQMWVAFLGAIGKRGEKVGEKTMYDTIRPAIDALELAYSEGKTLAEACESVDKAAKIGMESTKDMIALRGRSSRLGERTIGHIDPGSASMYTIISTFFITIKRITKSSYN